MPVTAAYNVGQEVYAIGTEVESTKWYIMKGIITHICIQDAVPTIQYTLNNKTFVEANVLSSQLALTTWITNNIPDLVVV